MKTKTQSLERTHVELRYNKKRFICFMLSIGAKSQNFVSHTIAVENDLQFFSVTFKVTYGFCDEIHTTADDRNNLLSQNAQGPSKIDVESYVIYKYLSKNKKTLI